MIPLLLLSTLSASASAADPPGEIVATELPSRDGSVRPLVFIGLIDPPNPDDGEADPPGVRFINDGHLATTTVQYDGSGEFALNIVVSEDANGVRQITYLSADGRNDQVVWGEGAPERLIPPDAGWPPDPCFGFPPDPCFQFEVLLGDGTTLEIYVAISSENGKTDPGSRVGSNPQPDPPGFPVGFEMDFSAWGGDDASVSVGLSSGGKALELY